MFEPEESGEFGFTGWIELNFRDYFTASAPEFIRGSLLPCPSLSDWASRRAVRRGFFSLGLRVAASAEQGQGKEMKAPPMLKLGWLVNEIPDAAKAPQE